ncbi:MAG: class I SAM-dependent methyltransferase [Candidatus Saganbacteria bacterium]|nr:class I SAM-dependent methyltransferase [Candidatus Saganbacteria bacterium]
MGKFSHPAHKINLASYTRWYGKYHPAAQKNERLILALPQGIGFLPQDYQVDPLPKIDGFHRFVESVRSHLHSLGLEAYLDCFVFRDYEEPFSFDSAPVHAIALTRKGQRSFGKSLVGEEAVLEYLTPFITQDRNPTKRRIAICSLFYYPLSHGPSGVGGTERSPEELKLANATASALSQRLDKVFIEGGLTPELTNALIERPSVVRSILQDRTIVLEWRLRQQLIGTLEGMEPKTTRAHHPIDIPTIREVPAPAFPWIDGYLPPELETKLAQRFNKALQYAFDLIISRNWLNLNLAEGEPLRILSLGCGTCPEAEGVVAYFEEKNKTGPVHLFGVDPGEAFIEEARRAWNNLPAFFVKGDATQTEVMDQLPPRIDILILRRPNLRLIYTPDNPDWKTVLELALPKLQPKGILFAVTALPEESYELSRMLGEFGIPPALDLFNPWSYLGTRKDITDIEAVTFLEQRLLLTGQTLLQRLQGDRTNAMLDALSSFGLL